MTNDNYEYGFKESLRKHGYRLARDSALAKPFNDTLERAQALYSKAIEDIHKKIDAPEAGKYNEVEIAAATSKLSGMLPQNRFIAIRKNIDSGSDLVMTVLLRGDPFLTGDLISAPEREVLISRWRGMRFPEEMARLHRLEVDLEAVSNSSAILMSYQRRTHNPAVAAAGTYQPPPTRGAPGPAPKNYSHSPSLAERARYVSQAIAATTGRVG